MIRNLIIILLICFSSFVEAEILDCSLNAVLSEGEEEILRPIVDSSFQRFTTVENGRAEIRAGNRIFGYHVTLEEGNLRAELVLHVNGPEDRIVVRSRSRGRTIETEIASDIVRVFADDFLGTETRVGEELSNVTALRLSCQLLSDDAERVLWEENAPRITNIDAFKNHGTQDPILIGSFTVGERLINSRLFVEVAEDSEFQQMLSAFELESNRRGQFTCRIPNGNGISHGYVRIVAKDWQDQIIITGEAQEFRVR